MRRPATLLLVEDDQSMLDGMHDLLISVDIGYDVHVKTAGNGIAALDRMNDKTPDLIVSDIMMPHMDGYQFLQEVRENPTWIHIPFIFLTAKGEKSEIHEGRLSGADLYIVKPFDSGELLELIQGQLRKTFLQRDARQQQVDNVKRKILQILNHEFRTPLTYVTAYYEMLADGVSHFSGQSNFQEYLRGIQAGCVRLTSLVEDLIQVIELRTSGAERKFRQHACPVDDLGAVLKEVAQASLPAASKKNLRIHVDIPETLPLVFGYRPYLTIVFQRLLDNAIKFTRQTPDVEKTIKIHVEMTDSFIRVSCKDQGVGFPERLSGQIFDLFFQYNREIWEQQGAGVGLTIAKGLTELHNGHVEVVSQEDLGSQFTVVLPIHDGSGLSPIAKSSSYKEATILIVEDDTHLLEGLQELLEISDDQYVYSALTANDGIKGLEVLEETQPDLIISDIAMPKMGGFEFLARVRQNPDWVQIPFIFLTARGELHEIHDGLRSGVEEYITKPYDSDELLELVAIQLDRHFTVQGVISENFEELKRSILSLITPDFRLPLSSVTTYSEKLADGFQQAQTEEELKDSLHGIQASSIRLTSLVEDFIALAELKTGEAIVAHELRAQPVHNLGTLICETAQLSSSALDHYRPIVVCHPNYGLPPVFGNSITILSSLKRVILSGINLMTMESDQVVTVSADHSREAVAIKVHFSSQPDEEVTRLIKTVLETGDIDLLGSSEFSPALSIAKGHLQLSGGLLTFENRDIDGSSFVITIPTHHPSRAGQ